MQPIDLQEKFAAFSDHWAPKIIARFNGHEILAVKAAGAFVWHAHADTDDVFLVLKGRLTIRRRDGEVVLGPGQLHVVPRGVEHCPVAEEGTEFLVLEPAGTPNTGDPATAAEKHAV